MFPGYSQEHETFRQSVRGFVEREIRPNIPAWEEQESVSRELFRKMARLDLLGIRLSPEWGGSGLDFWYTTILVQELVRSGSIGLVVSVLAHAEFATRVIDLAGSPELKERFVRPAIAGEIIGCLGVTEPGTGSDVAAIQTRAERAGEELVINGSKTFISNGSQADFVTLAVRTGEKGYGGISLVVVPTDTAGFTCGRKLKKIGTHASDTAELFFEDCRVPASHIVGNENGGFKLIMQAFSGERLVLSVMICAQMRLMFEEARRYGHERHTFGRPLLGNQVWRHRLADVATSIEAAERLTYHAIDLYVRGEPANKEISMAKLFSAEACRTVAYECAQIFGGNSYMEEYPIARLHRDSLAFSIGAGTSEMMRELIARECGLAAGDGKGS